MRTTERGARQNARSAATLIIIVTFLIAVSAAAAATRAPVRIMPCGDSITYDNHSGDTRPDSLRTGYRQPLWLLLQDSGYDVDFVGKVRAGYGAVPAFDPDNEGHPGWRDDQIADSIYVWLEQNPADIVLLHIGTNGLDTDESDVEDILDEVDRYESTYSADVTVLLARIINRMNHVCPNPSTTTAFNDSVAAMAQRRIDNAGDRIVLVDMECGAGMDYREQPIGDMYDSLHPTDGGYAKMADLWFAHLTQILTPAGCPAGMTHYWQFEDPVGPPYADSFGDDPASCANCPASVAGIVGDALAFDGADDEVAVPNDGSWDWGADGGFSIEFWMWKDTACDGLHTDFNEVIVGRDDPGSSLHWWVGVGCGSEPQGRPVFQLRDTSGAGDAIWGTTLLTDGVWHHVAAVRDAAADSNRLYVDGHQEASLYFDYANGFGGTTELEIGFMDLSDNYRFNGIVDEVATYDRALAPAEILAHYQSGLSGVGYCSAAPSAPTITSSPVVEAVVGRPYAYDAEATGFPTPTFSLGVHPDGMDIDAVTGLVTWTPIALQVGGNAVEIVATNTARGTDTQSFTIAVSEAPTCPDGMVHYWTFDDGSGGTASDALASLDGTLTSYPSGSRPTWDSGVVGGALDFNGTSEFVTVPDNATLDWGADESFTIELWCSFTNVASRNKVMIGRDNRPDGEHWWLGAEQGTGYPYFNLLNDDDQGDNIIGATAMNDGMWHHLVALRDAATDTCKVYLDGGLEGAFHFDYGNGFQAPTTLGIGYMAYTGNPDYYYDGLLDEIALYDRALTLTEIKQHNADGLAGQGYCTVEDSPPVITSTPPTSAAVGALYTYDVNASGHPAPTFSLSTAPAGMDIDNATGLITWTPTAGQEGSHDVTVAASNTARDRAVDTQSYTINVSAAVPCPAEMTAYWRLDETSGSTYEDSFGDHDASASSAPAPVAGTVGGAQAFDGSSDFIAVPAHADFDWEMNDSFTIEYWMRKDTSCGGSDIPSNEVIVGRDDASGATDIHWWTGVWCSGTPQGAAVFQLRDENRNGDYVAGTTVIIDGDWHHVVCIRDGGADSNKIFVDGDFEGGIYWDYTAGFSSASGEPIEIGRQHNGFYYDGEADEIAIYARALTPAEIEAHHLAGLSGQGYCEVEPTPPVIVSAPDTTATAGFLYTYDVDATGYPAPTYALTVSPNGMGINSQTGLISWTPTSMQVGAHDVTVEATNTARATDFQSFVVHVTEGIGEIAIMPLGDSITDGEAGSTDDTGYRRSLYLQLMDAGYEINFVGSESSGIPDDFDRNHEGHGGWRADQIRDGVYDWLEANPADIVLLHIGTNDVSGGNEDVDEVEAILDSIDTYENSTRRDITVFVARIILRGDAKNPQTVALNDSVEVMVNARIGAGDRLVMVDMENALTYPDHLADTVHPNDAGYQVMADTWFGAIDSFLSGVAISNLVLTSTSGSDLDGDDLVASYDVIGEATTSATAWNVNGSPLMVAYLPMEGGAANALLDYSGSGNHGSTVGDPTWDAEGGFDSNGCLVFDGNGDYVDLGECMPTGAYTKTAWYLYEPGNSWNNIISGQTNHAFWVADYSGFRLAGGHDETWDQVSDPTAFPVGAWTFCALTYDPAISGGKLVLYRNGAKVDSATGISGITSDTRAYIGTYQDECCEVKGKIDDARIYGFALSPQQIAALYDAGSYDPDTIVAEETSVGEIWQALVTPFSESQAGALYPSNTITVQTDEPTPPTIVSTPITDATVGRFYGYDVNATGVPAPTYSLATAPDGMEIDYTTGLIAWTPGAEDVGPNNVTVVATNTARGTDTQSFTIDVAPAPVCPEAMVHYWRLDEIAGPPYEDSYGDADMTCSNCPSPTTGIVGDGQEFDGSTDEVQIPDDGTFDWDADDSFTIEYWMFADDPVMAENRVIVGRDGGPTSLHWWIGYDSSNGKARFQLQDVNAHGRYIGAVGPVVNDGVWHHMAAVRNDTLGINIIYVDGAVVDTAYYDYTAGFAESVPVQVGYIELASHHYRYPGKLDELASHERALSADEIEDHYLAGLAGHGYCVTEETIPVITTSPVADAVVDALYVYDVDAAGHPQPTFALTVGPATMTIDEASGLVEWTPASADTGACEVEVVASNTAGADTQAFSIDVSRKPENIVCSPDSLSLRLGEVPGAISIDYLGGGDGLLYSYSIGVMWDTTLAVAADTSVIEGDLLSGVAPTFFSARSTGANEITIDCSILGGHDGVAGPGTMCTIPFAGLAPGVSPLDITIIKVRDRFNQDVTGFAEEDGVVVVLDALVVTADATIENTTLSHTNGFIKNGDAVHLTATVTQVIPLGRGVTVAADLSGFGGSPEAPPDSYDGTTAIWDLTAVTCAPANGAIEIIVTGANASNETSSDADTIFADNTPPTAVTDFDAVPGHERCELTWANGTDDNLLGVTVRRTGIPSEYPSYSTFITEWPVEEAETLYPAGPDSGHAVYDGTPIEALVDTVSPRGICFYQAFCYDEAMNVGPASTTARDAATDYWLGDVTDGGAPGMYDGYVGFEDLMIFAIHYGSTGPVGQGAECDFGPTVHPVRGGLGLPTPDGAVEFEDLMIFALNYGETSPIVRAVPLLPDAAAGGTPVLTLDRRGATDAGDVEIALRLEGNTGEVKGLSAVVAYDASELRLVAVRRSEEFASPSAEVFFWHEMTVGGVRVDAAVLGSGLAIGGSGDIAVMTFRPIADGFDVSFASGILRDAANVPIDAELGTYNGMSEPPLAFRLLQNVPNPFNPITTVGYHVPSTSAVKVEIYDVTGRLVRTLVDGEAVPGRHCAIWDGRSDTGSQVGSGIYFCRMEAEDFLDTRKMLLLK